MIQVNPLIFLLPSVCFIHSNNLHSPLQLLAGVLVLLKQCCFMSQVPPNFRVLSRSNPLPQLSAMQQVLVSYLLQLVAMFLYFMS